METKSLWSIIKQTFLEGEKGSMKAVSAFLTMMLICFLVIFPTLKDKSIDYAVMLELMGFICILYGIKGWQAVSMNNKNPSADGNGQPTIKK